LENQYIEIGIRSAITPVAAVAATATSPAVTAVARQPPITQQMVDDAKAIKKAYDEWIVEDDRILGAINMKCSAIIQQINASVNSAQVLWQNLEDQYGVATLAGIFNNFQQATSWKFEDKKDPTQSLNGLLAIINRLSSEGIVLPENVQAMIVLGAVPKHWDNFAAVVLATTDPAEYSASAHMIAHIGGYDITEPEFVQGSSKDSGKSKEAQDFELYKSKRGMGVSSINDKPQDYDMDQEADLYYDDYYSEYNSEQWYETIKKLETANYLFIEAAMKMMFPKL